LETDIEVSLEQCANTVLISGINSGDHTYFSLRIDIVLCVANIRPVEIFNTTDVNQHIH